MEKIRKILCVLWGHPRIVDTFLGMVWCARCGEDLGDQIGGTYSTKGDVILGHDCETCRKNYKELTWRDKLLTKKKPWSAT